jgi:2-oxoglutarate ferredoxin oxidoreductase subunit alpha
VASVLEVLVRDLPVKGRMAFHILGGEDREVLRLGYLLERTSARIGLDVISEFVPNDSLAAERPLFKLKVSELPQFWIGDIPNVLIAFDFQAFLKRKGPLPIGSTLIYDCTTVNELQPDRFPGVVAYPVPMAGISQKLTGHPYARAMVTLGVISKLFDLSPTAIEASLHEGTSVNRRSQASNIKAFHAGVRYSAEFLKKGDAFLFPLAPEEKDCLTLSGNEARRRSALKAGCHYFFIDRNVPLSPYEELNGRTAFLPGEGFHVENFEMGFAARILGASLSRAKVMVETTGEDRDLVRCLMGFASELRTPLVMVGIESGKRHAGDWTFKWLGQAMVNPDGPEKTPGVVMVPSNPTDCFDLVKHAFRLANTFRRPALILSNEVLCRLTQTIRKPAAHPGKTEKKFNRTGLRSILDPISPEIRPAGLNSYQIIQDEYEAVEWQGPISAEVGFVGWGLSQLAIREAMRVFKAIGFPAAALYPKTLWPPPKKALEKFASMVKKLVVVEGSFGVPCDQVIQTVTSIKPVVLTPSNGSMITPEDLFEKEDWL